MSGFEAPDSPPPPAYEITDQEFDQKTAETLQTSQLSSYESKADHTGDVDAGDDTLSQFCDSISTAGSGSHSVSSGAPSYVHYRWDGRTAKEREANGAPWAGSQLTSGSMEKERPILQPVTRLVVNNHTGPEIGSALTRSDTVSSQDRRTPPPMFESMGPSLDGPPYEPPAAQITLTYNGGDSRPASPLTESEPHSHYMSFLQPYVPPPPSTSQSHSHSHSMQRAPLPQPPQFSGVSHHPYPTPSVSPPISGSSPPPRPYPAPRATPSPRPPSVYNAPAVRVAFDPQVAYARRVVFTPPDAEQPAKHYNASAFYNSAVSSHISPVHPPSQRASSYQPERVSQPQPPRPATMYTHPQPHPSPQNPALHQSFYPVQHQQHSQHQPMPRYPSTNVYGAAQPGAQYQQNRNSYSYSDQGHGRPW